MRQFTGSLEHCRKLAYGASEGSFVDDNHTRRRHEVKFRLRNRQIFFPVPKSKLRFKLPCLAHYHPNQSGAGIHFKQDVANPFTRISRIVTRSATQHSVPNIGGMVAELILRA